MDSTSIYLNTLSDLWVYKGFIKISECVAKPVSEISTISHAGGSGTLTVIEFKDGTRITVNKPWIYVIDKLERN